MEYIIVPRLEVAMETAKIIEWLKKEGDEVTKGEPVLKVEGVKTTFEVEAPASGVLRKILVPAGAEIEVPTVVGLIGSPGEPLPKEMPSPKIVSMPKD